MTNRELTNALNSSYSYLLGFKNEKVITDELLEIIEDKNIDLGPLLYKNLILMNGNKEYVRETIRESYAILKAKQELENSGLSVINKSDLVLPSDENSTFDFILKFPNKAEFNCIVIASKQILTTKAYDSNEDISRYVSAGINAYNKIVALNKPNTVVIVFDDTYIDSLLIEKWKQRNVKIVKLKTSINMIDKDVTNLIRNIEEALRYALAAEKVKIKSSKNKKEKTSENEKPKTNTKKERKIKNEKKQKEKRSSYKSIKDIEPDKPGNIAVILRETNMTYPEFVKASKHLAKTRKDYTFLYYGLKGNDPMSPEKIAKLKNTSLVNVRKVLSFVYKDIIDIKENNYQSLRKSAKKDISYSKYILKKYNINKSQVDSVIDFLPPTERKYFEDRYYDNKSIDEIAKKYKVKPKSITSSTTNTLKKIIKYINEGYTEPEKKEKKYDERYTYEYYLKKINKSESEVDKAIQYLPDIQKEYFTLHFKMKKKMCDIAKNKGVSNAFASSIISLAKENIVAIIDANYDITKVELKTNNNSKKDKTLKELKLTEEELLIYMSLLSNRAEDCMKYTLNIGDKVPSKKDLIDTYKLTEKAISSATANGKMKIKKMINDPSIIDYVKQDADFNALLKIRYKAKTEEEVRCALNILIEEEKEFIKLFLGIDTKKRTSKQISEEKFMTDGKVRKVLYNAIEDLDEILIYGKIPDRKEINRSDSPLYRKEIIANELGKNNDEIIKALEFIPKEEKKYFLAYYENNESYSKIAKDEGITKGSVKKHIKLAKEHIVLVIDSNYELQIEEDNLQNRLKKEYNISLEKILEYAELLSDYQKDCLLNMLEVENCLSKEEIIKKYKKDDKSYNTICYVAKREIKKCIENDGVKFGKQNSGLCQNIDECCKCHKINKGDFILVVKSFEGNRNIYTRHYYGIDTKKLSIKEIATKYNTEEKTVINNIKSAISQAKKIINSDKIYNVKLNSIKDKLKQIYDSMEKDEEFRKKVELSSYPAAVAISLISNFNFNFEQIMLALEYDSKEKVINLLLAASELLKVDEDNISDQDNNYQDDNALEKDNSYKK